MTENSNNAQALKNEIQTLRTENERLESLLYVLIEERTAKLSQANEKLQQNVRILDTIFNSVAEGIVVADEAGNFILFNHAAEHVLGLGATDSGPDKWSETYGAFYPDGATPFPTDQLPLVRAINGESVDSVEMLIRNANVPEGVYIQLTGRPLRDDNGEVKGGVAVFYDITERKKKEAELRQSQKLEAIGTLAGGVAHDFNNLLYGMLGYVEMTWQDLPEGHAHKLYMDQILRIGDRAKGLIQQILMFSRSEELERKPLRLVPLIKEALKMVRMALPSTIDIQQALSNAEIQIMADANQIHQILINLCTNASYAMRETGGLLEIRVETIDLDSDRFEAYDLSPGHYSRLTVRDTGSGMPPDVLERIFEPFFTTKPVGEGSGMGLAVAHAIVKNHEGAIWCTSQVGQGTTFEIWFPLIRDTVYEAAETQSSFVSGTGRILFVDDEAFLVGLGQKMLERLGYRVTATTDSAEALEFFKETPDDFDLILTDHTMPRMTGVQLAEEVRKLREDIPIILLSGFNDPLTSKHVQTLQHCWYLLKPLSYRKLSEMLHELLVEKAAE